MVGFDPRVRSSATTSTTSTSTITPATTTPATTTTTTTTTAATPGEDARFVRERRLSELVLGGRDAKPIATASSPSTAPPPGQVHQVRLAAMGMMSATDLRLGDRPVPAPVALPDGAIGRVQQQAPAWQAREMMNQPYLQPGAFIKSDDLLDFQVLRTAPSFQGALRELVTASGARVYGDVVDAQLGAIPNPASLTPLARLCLHLMKVTSSTSGITVGGGLHRALTRLFADVGHSFVVGRTDLDRALGPQGGALLWDALMEAIPAQRGLQAVLHRAELPLEPTSSDVPLTREEAEVLLRDAPATLSAMVASAPIPKTLPALTAASGQVAARAFADVHVVAVQHVLSTNRTMFAAMEAHGLDPKKTEVVGIPYSTNYVVEHAFRESGYTIHTPLVVDPNDITRAYEVAVEAALDRAVDRALADGKPILLVDDGGKATAVAAKKYPHLAHLFRAVEQTTRGLTEIANVEAALGRPLPFPVVDVAKSPLKAHEMPKIGAQVVGEIEKITRQIGGLDLAGKDVLVTGFGPIGRGVALALAARGAHVTIWDPSPDAQARARADGFIAAASRGDALQNKALIVGASGHRSVTRDDLKLLAKNCVLCSASSRDVEIDLSTNRDADIESVPLLTAGRGDRRFVTRVWRLADKDIVVLKNGFPLNFNGDYETGTAGDIEQTRALMFLAAAQAVGGLTAPDVTATTTSGVQPLSLAAQRNFAQAFGIAPP